MSLGFSMRPFALEEIRNIIFDWSSTALSKRYRMSLSRSMTTARVDLQDQDMTCAASSCMQAHSSDIPILSHRFRHCLISITDAWRRWPFLSDSNGRDAGSCGHYSRTDKVGAPCCVILSFTRRRAWTHRPSGNVVAYGY